MGVFENPPAVSGDGAGAWGSGIKGGPGQGFGTGERGVKGVGKSGLAEVVEKPAEVFCVGKRGSKGVLVFCGTFASVG